MGIPHGHPKPSFLKIETHQHAFPSENQPPSEFASVQSPAGSEVAVFWTCWLMWQLYRGRYQVFFFPFSAPYNIFFFFWLHWVFVAARRLSAGVVHKLLTEGASLVEHGL